MRSPSTVLIPIVTGREDGRDFLLQAAGKARKAVVVFLLDQSSGLTGTEMEAELGAKEALLASIEAELHALGKKTKIFNEWGNVKDKMPLIAQREKVGEIVVMRPIQREAWRVEELQALGIPVRVVG